MYGKNVHCLVLCCEGRHAEYISERIADVLIDLVISQLKFAAICYGNISPLGTADATFCYMFSQPQMLHMQISQSQTSDSQTIG